MTTGMQRLSRGPETLTWRIEHNPRLRSPVTAVAVLDGLDN